MAWRRFPHKRAFMKRTQPLDSLQRGQLYVSTFFDHYCCQPQQTVEQTGELPFFKKRIKILHVSACFHLCFHLVKEWAPSLHVKKSMYIENGLSRFHKNVAFAKPYFFLHNVKNSFALKRCVSLDLTISDFVLKKGCLTVTYRNFLNESSLTLDMLINTFSLRLSIL